MPQEARSLNLRDEADRSQRSDSSARRRHEGCPRSAPARLGAASGGGEVEGLGGQTKGARGGFCAPVSLLGGIESKDQRSASFFFH